MNDIKLVVAGGQAKPLDSEEFRYGWRQLRGVVGTDMPWMELGLATVDATALAAAFATAPQCNALTAGLPDSAVVLLLAHGRLLMTRLVLERMSVALHGDPCVSAVHAFDSKHPPELTPDYCTLRGMERYLDRLEGVRVESDATTQYRVPLVTLTTMGAVRRNAVRSNDAWLPGAFVHDFSDYQGGRREEVIPLIPPHTRFLLDVGGGEGRFLQAAKEALRCETHLAEWSAGACAVARTHVDKVWEGDFFTQTFLNAGPHLAETAVRFDCISFLDVLEHTSEPEQWIERAKALLAPGGTIVASIPNVGHWGVIADLLEGRWDYCPVGIHCVTHLRFFSEHSVRGLFARCGLEIEHLESVKVPCPETFSEHWQSTPGLATKKASWDDYAFLVRGRPKAEVSNL